MSASANRNEKVAVGDHDDSSLKKSPKTTHNKGGYHVFFTEERARLILQMKKEKIYRPRKNQLTRKQTVYIYRKWRSLDIVTRSMYEVRSQQEIKKAMEEEGRNESKGEKEEKK